MRGKFLWKLINKDHPISIQSKFSINFNKAINSNDNKKLFLPFRRTNIAKTFLHYQGFKSWSFEISTKLKNKQYSSCKAFTKSYKAELTDCLPN